MPKKQDAEADLSARLERALHVLERQTRNVERLSTLVEASKVLTGTLDLCQVFDSILDLAARNTGADRASLFLVEAERSELWSLIAQGVRHTEIRLPIGRGLAGWVAKNGVSVNLADAHGDARFDPSFDEMLGYTTKSILVMPVRGRSGRVIGVLELLNKRGGAFGGADIEFVEGITAHAAIALENAQLHKSSLARLRVEQELALARAIHKSALPEILPTLDGFDVAIRQDTCPHVGGDYYDFIPLGRKSELFVIADIEGRGAPAALVASTVHTALHTLADHVRSLEGIAFHLNEAVRKATHGGRYMTAFLGLIDLTGRTLHYVNAGHPPPVLIGKGGASQLVEGGAVMGAFPEASFTRGSRRLQPGDVILGYTDGITDCTGLGGREYGIERLLMVAGSRSGHSARDLVDAVYGDLEAHASCDGGLDADDRLLMAIRTI